MKNLTKPVTPKKTARKKKEKNSRIAFAKPFVFLANAKSRTTLAKIFVLHKAHKNFHKTPSGYV